MDKIEEDPPPTPFWVQQNTTFLQRNTRRHHRQSSSSSLFLNTGVLVVVLMLAAIVFLYAVVIPSFLNLTQKVIIKPSSVKKSWDSLNLVLVLFAIICGFLGRNQSSDQTTPRAYEEDVPRSEGIRQRNLPSSDQWYEYPSSSRKMESRYGRSSSGLTNSLRRTSSSYPDFQRESPWLTEADKWRFYDDSYVNEYRSLRSEEDRVQQPKQGSAYTNVDEDDSAVKNIEVDTFVSNQQLPSMTTPSPTALSPEQPKPPSMTKSPATTPLPPKATAIASKLPPPSAPPLQPRVSTIVTPSPAPPASPALLPPSPSEPPQESTSPLPPQSSNVHKKRSRLAQEARHHNRRERSDMREFERKRTQSQPPPPPPSPPPPTFELHSEAKSGGRIRKKRGGVTVTKDILTSLYHQRKRKMKQRQRSHENLGEAVPPRQSNPRFPPPSPPPPPPPPLPHPSSSVFHNLFSSKKGKNKKVHSVWPPTPPPPRPPPPPRHASISHPSKSNTRFIQDTYKKPSFPARNMTDLSYVDETNMGNASPLVPIPPPPPPPPFKMPPWKFTVRGDYVKIESNNNSPRSNSELDDDEEALSSGKDSPSPMAMGNRVGSNSQFCPSPDVNTKADDFIARFKDKLKLERMDSIKQGNVRSRLSYESSPSLSPHLSRS